MQLLIITRYVEAIAAVTINLPKEGMHTNLADIVSKLMSGPKKNDLLQYILWVSLWLTAGEVAIRTVDQWGE
jgi:hypothetical protein